jgi:hypothetical protein
MGQPEFVSQEGKEIGTGTPALVNSSTVASTSEDPYLSEIHGYRDQIEEVSKLINSLPQWELASTYGKVKEVEKQIAEAIENLRALKGNPPVEGFNKSAVIDHLLTAREELNQAARLASSPDVQVQNLCFGHLKECYKHLNQAKDLISSTFNLY